MEKVVKMHSNNLKLKLKDKEVLIRRLGVVASPFVFKSHVINLLGLGWGRFFWLLKGCWWSIDLHDGQFKVPEYLDDHRVSEDVTEPHNEGDEHKDGGDGAGVGDQQVQGLETLLSHPLTSSSGAQESWDYKYSNSHLSCS